MPEPRGSNTATMATDDSDDSDDSFKAKIQYLARDDQHQLVKPYYLYFEYDSEIAPTNTAGDDSFVHICNARNLGIPPREMFFEWGFAQLHLDCPLSPEEYYYDKKVEETLYPKYKSIAQFLFPNAARVEILEHAVSKDPKTGLQKADRSESRFANVTLFGYLRAYNDTSSRQTNRVIMCTSVRALNRTYNPF
jgi:hypothetical protein